jgi:hypothetical protein
MKKILNVLFCLFLVALNANAKAGTSVSKSGSSFSSSKSSSYSTSSTNYGTKANNTTPTTQYSSTYSSTTSGISSASPVASTSSTAAVKPSVPAPTTGVTHGPTSSNINPGSAYNSTTYNSARYNQDSSGGFMSSFLGAGAGYLVADALFGHNNHSGGSGGSGGSYVSGGTVTNYPQSAPGGSYQSGTVVQPQQSITFWGIIGFILSLISQVIILAAIIYGLYRVYRYFKTRTMKNDPVSRDKNLPVFEVMFKEIQKAVASKDSSATEKLGKMTTSEMYDFFLNIRSENEEKGIENTVDDIKVLSIVTKNFEEDDESGYIYHSVKIRFSMIDFYTENNEIVLGSKDEQVTDIEVWTFLSKDGGKNWKLSAIEQYPQ